MKNVGNYNPETVVTGTVFASQDVLACEIKIKTLGNYPVLRVLPSWRADSNRRPLHYQ